LKYDSTSLAKECGMRSRPNFSKLFKEINGITLIKVIKEQEQKLENESLKND
jgi:hypothetical protein